MKNKPYPPWSSSCYDSDIPESVIEYQKFDDRTKVIANNILAINSKPWKVEVIAALIHQAYDKYENAETDTDPFIQLNNDFDWVPR